MSKVDSAIERYLALRKRRWEAYAAAGDEAEQAALARYDADMSIGEIAAEGGIQGLSHGWADEGNRDRHMRAHAANPVLYDTMAVGGLLGTGLALRAGPGVVGRAITKPLRDSAKGYRAIRPAEKLAEAKRIEAAFDAGPLAMSRTMRENPGLRGRTMDAIHGGALGSGGMRPSHEMTSGERVAGGAIGSAVGGLLAPVAPAALRASTNIPLAWGGRRFGSEKMLEPVGVTTTNHVANVARALRGKPSVYGNDVGNPRRSIEIAWARDEAAQRGNAGGAPMQRDKNMPLDSQMPEMRAMADKVVARQPKSLMEARARERDKFARSIEEEFPAARKPVLPDNPPLPVVPKNRTKPVVYPDSWIKAMMEPLTEPVAAGRPPDVAVLTPIRGQSKQKRQWETGQKTWLETLQDADASSGGAVMPRIRTAVGRWVADNERTVEGQRINDLPETQAFLKALDMGVKKSARGVPATGVLARKGPLRTQARMDEEAIQREAGKTPLRERHAETLAAEMLNVDKWRGPYTGPTKGSEQALVLRGDDRMSLLNPLPGKNRFGRARDWEVNMAGAGSGPTAWAADYIIRRNYAPDPGEPAMPPANGLVTPPRQQGQVQAAQQAAVPTGAQTQPQAQAAAAAQPTATTLQAQAPANGLAINSAPAAPVKAPEWTAQKVDPRVAVAQQALNKLYRMSLAIDGRYGNLTTDAVIRFQRDQGHPDTGVLTDYEMTLLARMVQ